MKKLFELAENENIKVIEKYLPNRIKGFFYRKEKTCIICLEQRLNRTNKRIIFAEELGHYYTSSGDAFDLSRPDFTTCSKNEYLARKWAAKYLIPDRKFKKIIETDSNLNLKQIADDLGVNKEFLEFRYNVYLNNS
jgi:Zn-dependent peptidase ImmA (M78 family)